MSRIPPPLWLVIQYWVVSPKNSHTQQHRMKWAGSIYVSCLYEYATTMVKEEVMDLEGTCGFVGGEGGESKQENDVTIFKKFKRQLRRTFKEYLLLVEDRWL